MRRSTTALVMAVLLVVAGAAVPATVIAQSNETATETPTETATPGGATDSANDSANESAGELMQGAIGVQEAEIDGEIRTRSYGIRTARAETDDAKADVVATELRDVEGRLDELEDRKERLEAEREAGTITRGQYRAEMAKLAVEIRTAETLTNESADTAENLPADLLERKGVDATAIRTLSERANELGGPEVSRIARDVAGPATSTDRAGNATAGGGTPEDASERTGERLETDGGNRTATGDGGTRTATDDATDGKTDADDGSDRGVRTPELARAVR